VKGGVFMNRIISKIKYYSGFIVPVIIVSCIFCLDKSFEITINTIKKTDDLVGIITSLIGILLTVLTIYLSFPKSEDIKRRMKNSGHNYILLSNIAIGIIILTLSLLIWLFTSHNNWVVYLFCGGLSNTLITFYYILVLSKFS
jgi:uncharacterized membrane protein YidH (DUF202 family)